MPPIRAELYLSYTDVQFVADLACVLDRCHGNTAPQDASHWPQHLHAAQKFGERKVAEIVDVSCVAEHLGPFSAGLVYCETIFREGQSVLRLEDANVRRFKVSSKFIYALAKVLLLRVQLLVVVIWLTEASEVRHEAEDGRLSLVHHDLQFVIVIAVVVRGNPAPDVFTGCGGESASHQWLLKINIQSHLFKSDNLLV